MTKLDKLLICEFCEVLADEIMLRTLGAGEIRIADYHAAVNAAFAKATLELEDESPDSFERDLLDKG